MCVKGLKGKRGSKDGYLYDIKLTFDKETQTWEYEILRKYRKDNPWTD